MQITQARRISQVFFFALFVCFMVVAQWTLLKGYPISLFLQLSPLVGLANALTTHALYPGLMWCLAVIVPTLLLGRFFCGWVCPMGALHHFTGWALGKWTLKEKIAANQYSPWQSMKYVILAAVLALSFFGSLQIGLLDPLCLLYRSFITAMWPVVDWLALGHLELAPRQYVGGWVIGVVFIGLLAANLWMPRFFCRVLCPLGALLGVLARFALVRIDRNPASCTKCNLCLRDCEGACDPHASLRLPECVVCFNCIKSCDHASLAFRPFPGWQHERRQVDITRRQVLTGVAAGLTAFPLLRRSGDLSPNFSPLVIRPPGAVEELRFLERCVKCGQCLRVCPSNTLQPALLEAGLEGLWTPIHNMRMGACEYNCVLCGQVCPTGAIQAISMDQKHGTGAFEKQGPVKIGIALVDRNRCLPWAMDKPCVVCQEVCPTSPKAIFTRPYLITNADGSTKTMNVPIVAPHHCIGCGMCERACPVADLRAIRVTAAGETRSQDRALTVDHQRIIPHLEA